MWLSEFLSIERLSSQVNSPHGISSVDFFWNNWELEKQSRVFCFPPKHLQKHLLDIKQLYANLQELTREMNNNFMKCLSIDILTANILQCALIIYFIYRFDPSDRSKLKYHNLKRKTAFQSFTYQMSAASYTSVLLMQNDRFQTLHDNVWMFSYYHHFECTITIKY